jgi:uncharacterized protein
MTTPFSSDTKINGFLKSILFCLLFTILLIILSFSKSFFPAAYERMAYGIIGTIAALLVTFLFLRFDKKKFSSIGLSLNRNTPLQFIRGFLVGIGLMGILSFSVIYATGFTIELNPESNVFLFLWFTLPLLPLAFMEELAFRAYPLRQLNKTSGIRISILVTSLLFALYHLANGWTFQNAFLGAGSWGIFFGTAAIYANGIAMPTGMHYAVNLTTVAFGITDKGINLCVLKLRSGAPPDTYTGSRLSELLPQLCILLAGLFFMEWLTRHKRMNP